MTRISIDETLRNDLLTLLDDAAGRRVILEFLEKCNVLGCSFATDPYQTAFNEGVRKPGLWLLKAIEAARPGEGGQLIAEQSKKDIISKRDER